MTATTTETGLERHGIDPTGVVLRNPTTSQLYTDAIRRGDGRLAEGGPLVVDTGPLHRPLAGRQVRRTRARVRGADLVGRHQPADRRVELRRAATEGRGLPLRSGAAVRDRRLRRRRSGPPDRRASRHGQPVPRALREDDVHPADGRRARHPRAAGARAPRARGRSGPRGGRHAQRYVRRPPPDAHRGRDRRDVLRGRDQEVDLHRHERPASARGRLPDALLGERRLRRRRRDLLRPFRHGQDDALGRSVAEPDRRRRARVGNERRVQRRRRLLREGDPPLGRGRARHLPDDAHVRDDPRERVDGRARRSSTSTTTRRPRTPGRRTSSSRSRTLTRRRWQDTRGTSCSSPPTRSGSCRRSHGSRVSRRSTGSCPGSPPSSPAPRSASPSRSRRSRPASARRSCRSSPRCTRGCSARSSASTAPRSGSSTPAGRAGRSEKATGCRSGPRERCSARRSRALSPTWSTASTRCSASRFPPRCRTSTLRSSTRARRGRTRSPTTRGRASSPRCFGRTSKSGSPPRSTRRSQPPGRADKRLAAPKTPTCH